MRTALFFSQLQASFSRSLLATRYSLKEKVPASMTGTHEYHVHVETEFEGFAINDGKPDFPLRLGRLIPTMNVIELKRKEIVIDGRRVIPLGIIANSINHYDFIDQVKLLGLTIELKSVQ